ncbi:MAG: Beta-galactosidase [Anaerocolumna sp.]|jgi:beta-galactosidase|nr:Beta-galactosidase [Anaerocolumna sp.]
MSIKTFEIKDQFYCNEKPVKIISGGMHYFRIVPEYWRDRLEKLKALGCNTVETYIPWNMHEPKKGEFHFEGLLDIKRFINTAAELGLWVILRPSPYICAEWEFGGLPAWLLAEDNMRLRINYKPFMNHVKEYYKELFKIISPMQYQFGGPVIMMQVENEYGYYADDAAYLEVLKKMMVDNGAIVPLVTSDGPWGDALSCGSIEGVLPTCNFGSKVKEQFQVLEKYTAGRPLMIMEFWVGWFDSWGTEKHVTSNLKENCKDLEEALSLGNVNIYMFIGGTNFGFMNGSNYYDELKPDVTSYDYDAVLTEWGDITPKYLEFQKIIAKFTEIPQVELSIKTKKISYGLIKVNNKVGLFESLDDISQPVQNLFPLSMEKLGQNYGYILYRSELKKEKKLEKLCLNGANDRANIYMGNDKVITLYDRELLIEKEIDYNIEEDNLMSILVENMGRVNFGPLLEKQRKGIDSCIQINGHQHMDWSHYSLPFDNLDKLDFSKGYHNGCPAFYQFEFSINEIGDTFIDMDGWGKGCVFINGFNLGRFWDIGPQKKLYIPGPLLKIGLNEIIIFETEGKVRETVILSDAPSLG